MEELDNVVAEKEPTSQNLSPRELLREKNASEFKREGNPAEPIADKVDSKPADVKKADPIVKDTESDVKGNKGFQRRVDKLTARALTAEARYAELEKRLQAIEKPSKPSATIDPNHYLDQAEYIKALAAEQAQRATEEVLSKNDKEYSERAESEAKQREEAEKFYKRVDKTYSGDADKIAEFQGLVNDNVEVLNELPADVHDFVDDSPQGVKVLEAILKYPQLQDLIFGIKNPAYRLIKLTEIERALATPSASPAKPAPAVSSAPAPIGSVGSGGNSVINDEDRTFRERLLKRQKEINKARGLA